MPPGWLMGFAWGFAVGVLLALATLSANPGVRCIRTAGHVYVVDTKVCAPFNALRPAGLETTATVGPVGPTAP